MSKRNCSVYGCFNTEKKSKQRGLSVKFYCFPGREFQKERRQQWISFIRKHKIQEVPWEPSLNSRICSLHFVGGRKSEDPRKVNWNPTIQKGFADGCHDIPSPIVSVPSPSNTSVTIDDNDSSAICVICSHGAEFDLQKYLNHDDFSKFCGIIVGNKQMPGLIETLKSFEDLSLCCDCFSRMCEASSDVDNIKVVESRVRELQRSLLQELKQLQTVLRGFHEKMNNLRNSVLRGDPDKLLNCTGRKRKSRVFKLRDKIVKTANELGRFEEKIKQNVDSGNMGEIVQTEENLMELDETEMSDEEAATEDCPSDSAPCDRTVAESLKPNAENILQSDSPANVTISNTSPEQNNFFFRNEIIENIRKKLASVKDAKNFNCDLKHCQSHDWLEMDPFLEFPLIYNKDSGTLSVSHIEIEIDDTKCELICTACNLHVAKPHRVDDSVENFMWAHIATRHLLLFQCPQCISELDSLDKYREHLRSHDNKYICKICGTPCFSEGSLKCHEGNHEPCQDNIPDRRPCPRIHPRALRNTVPGFILNPYADGDPSCSFCRRTMPNEMVKCHEQFCSKGPRLPVMCEICGKTFTKRRPFLYHKQSHSVERPFLCNLCPSTFKTEGSLRSHIKTHSDERKFICGKGCGGGFKNSNSRNNHMKTCNGKGTPFRKKAKQVVAPWLNASEQSKE